MILACEVYNQLDFIDEVWLTPCGDGRADKKLRTTGADRVKMLELIKGDVVYEDLPIYINKQEIENGKYMPTIDLLTKLQSTYPFTKFYFTFGSDLAKSLPKWESGEQIINDFGLIMINRPGHVISDIPYIDKCHIINTNLDGSSTTIRNRIDSVLNKKNKIHLGISGLTSRSVLKYIYDNCLYKVESKCVKLLTPIKDNSNGYDHNSNKKIRESIDDHEFLDSY